MRRVGLLTAMLLAVVSSPGVAQTGQPMPPPVVTPPAPGGKRLATTGMVANWYPGAAGKARLAILLLGGSEGGVGAGAARQAADLVAHGYAVLQLAYFGAPGLPAQLVMVPLEYFDRALSWLGDQPTVRRDRIGIMGASKGAEAALLIAARHPDIRAVVVGSPSAAVWPGIDATGGEGRSSWSIKSKGLDHLSYGGEATTMFGGYQAGLNTLPAHRDAAIPVERIKGQVMLVCGKADTLWPSCAMSDIVKRRMAGRAIILAYNEAGHAVFGPPVGADAPGFASLGSLGGTPAGNDAARRDAWPKVLRFLAEHLGSGGQR